MAAKKADRRQLVLARYTDQRSRPHRVLLRRRLVLDLCAGEPPRLVARLVDGEGEPQARALLDGSAIDEGYLARARREPRPFIRALQADDLRPPEGAAGSERQDIDQAAEEPPLAA
jgi:hypothetical protein